MPDVILSCDPGVDVDDFTDVARALQEQSIGNLRLLRIGICCSESKSPGAIDALCTAMGQQPRDAIASWNSATFINGPSTWVTNVYANYSHPNVNLASGQPEYIAALRTTLHNAADGTIDLVETGPLHAIDALLQSASDGIDSRNGSDLIAAKVHRVYVVAGRPGDGSSEYNVDQDRTAASHFAANCPVPIYLCDVTIGDLINVGASEWGGALQSTNIVRYSYDQYGVGSPGRNAWSQPVFDVLAGRGGWTFQQGTWAVNGSTGLDTWTVNAGPHFRFIQTYAGSHYATFWTSLIAGYNYTAGVRVSWPIIHQNLPVIPAGGGGGGGALVAGFKVDLDASLTGSITASGGFVSNWADQSVNGNDLNNAVSGGPQTGAHTLNSLNVLNVYDGGGAYLTRATWASGSLATYTIHIVTKKQAAHLAAAVFLIQGVGGRRSDIYQHASGFWAYYMGATEIISLTAVDLNAHVFTLVGNGASSRLRMDGVQIASGSGGTDACNGLADGPDGHDSAQIVVYSGDLGDTDIAANEAFLKSKWGTP